MRYHLVMAGKRGQKERVSPRATWMSSKETDEFVNRLHGKLWRQWEGEHSVKKRYAVTVRVQP